MAGVFRVDHHHRARGNFVIHGEWFGQVGATEDAEGLDVEIHVLTAAGVVHGHVLDAGIEAADVHIGAPAVATDVGLLTTGPFDQRVSSIDMELLLRLVRANAHAAVVGDGHALRISRVEVQPPLIPAGGALRANGFSAAGAEPQRVPDVAIIRIHLIQIHALGPFADIHAATGLHPKLVWSGCRIVVDPVGELVESACSAAMWGECGRVVPDETTVVQRIGISARGEAQPAFGVVALTARNRGGFTSHVIKTTAHGAVVPFDVVRVGAVTTQDARTLLPTSAGNGGANNVIKDLVLPKTAQDVDAALP